MSVDDILHKIFSGLGYLVGTYVLIIGYIIAAGFCCLLIAFIISLPLFAADTIFIFFENDPKFFSIEF